MKKREFNKKLKVVTSKKTGRIDVDKISFLSNKERLGMVEFIVRNREPILIDLIPETIEDGWLSAMGYLYTKTTELYTFRCLAKDAVGASA